MKSLKNENRTRLRRSKRIVEEMARRRLGLKEKEMGMSIVERLSHEHSAIFLMI